MYETLRRILIDTARDIPYLIQSKHPKKIKLSILQAYLRLCLKRLFASDISHSGDAHIFGYTLSYFNFERFFLLFREIFFRNEYYFVSRRRDPIIFDCGANIGMASIYFTWLYPKCTIYAFEPDPETYKKLQKNITQNNLRNVHMHNVALVNKPGMIDFFIDKQQPGLPLMSIIRARLPKDTIKVHGQPLSDFISKTTVDFLKIDVEGAETYVLHDLSKTKKLNAIREMVIEYHHGIAHHRQNFVGFLQLLERNGFTYRIDAQSIPLYTQDTFQDIVIYAHRYTRQHVRNLKVNSAGEDKEKRIEDIK